MTKYRIWFSESELPIELEADTAEEARMKIEAHIYLDSLWEENSIEIERM